MDNGSRINRFDKKRRSTKLITTLGIVGGVLAAVLLLILILPFGENGTPAASDENENENEKETKNEESNQSKSNEETDTSKSGENEQEGQSSSENDGTSKQEEEQTDSTDKESDKKSNDKENESEEDNTNSEEITTESDDPNVVKTIKKDWEPIVTDQEGNHTTTYTEGTKDWKEMEASFRKATGLSEGNMINWWTTRGKDSQSVVGTVTNNAQTKVYRVYSTWVENEGWKPVKVEELKENDKKNNHKETNQEEQNEEANEEEEQ
nr:YrrS family protein [Pontibacillus yanchengensis]